MFSKAGGQGEEGEGRPLHSTAARGQMACTSKATGSATHIFAAGTVNSMHLFST